MHEYSGHLPNAVNGTGVIGTIHNVCVVTLTVTDSAGQSDSDTMLMIFLNQSPD